MSRGRASPNGELPGDDLPESGVVRGAAWTIVGMGVITTLYVGSDLLIPIALALLLSFVLSPIVSLAKRTKIPRSIAVVFAVALAFSVILGIGAIIAGQVGQLAGDLPKYQSTMRDKIQSMRGWTFGSGTLERAADMLQSLGKEFDAPEGGVTLRPGAKPERDGAKADEPEPPTVVEIRTPRPSSLENLQNIVSPLVHPMATAGIIVIFVIFVLLEREDLRNRLMSLAGARDIPRTTAAIDEAARRLSRFFLTQLGLNAGFGLVIGIGLWVIGVPSPALWGIVAGVLRFVPYVGAFIAAVFPMALAAAVDPGWTMLIATGALFAIIEPIVGHVIEPLVYGRSAGLSPVAVVVAATFWTALWGPIGLVLATPLTVCLVVLGRHVESLGFLATLLGDRPALTPAQLFYQRMLARDPAEASEKAEEFLRERSLSSYYEEVALPGLLLAQRDAEAGILKAERLAALKASVTELVEDLTDHDDGDPSDVTPTTDPEAVDAIETADKAEEGHKRAGWSLPRPRFGAAAPVEPAPEVLDPAAVICIGARTPVDQAAALIVAQVLAKNGVPARFVEAVDPALAEAAPPVWCLVALEASDAQLRLGVRRLKRSREEAGVVVARWRSDTPDWSAEAARRAVDKERAATRADAVALSLGDAVELCRAAKAASAQLSPPKPLDPPVAALPA